MTRRVLAFILCLAILLGTCFTTAWAEDEPDFTALETAAPVDDSLPAKSAILMEQDSGRILFEKDADIQLPPASITKIMTLLLVMEAIDNHQITLNDLVTCSPHAASMGGSQIWFEPGEQMSVDDLIKATAISSANDASVALGELIAGSEEAFVEMMNARAQELGMENTVFKNATGLDAEGHVSTARDIALMSRELIKHDLIKEYSSVWMSELRDGKTQLVNTNKLVRFYDGCTGLKTGTTDGAGSCLAATATRKGMSLVAVTLGSATSNDRFASARGLLDYGFANYTRVELPPLEELQPVKVRGGVNTQVEVQSLPPASVIVRAADKDSVQQEVTLVEDVQAPVEKGQLLGKVVVHVAGSKIDEYDLVAAQTIEKMTFFNALKQLLGYLIQM
ncbi:D-alanyl-D-alanine carboxypeptidase family protein [Youxingia wuxianensis]|uniref:serine-type D-Ala-D-Ala carboxypeptidase n=1 Tax=Youxingia wuxianensis TaxID=2763678 RepID=A0A926IHB6_9FIRM|nr:D-alanyl-D-alanine carboxypeptidase family protein [Youxingia wuxianensis]MBC8585749.1 D-alanyl-D-alanine carboxypeptidase [Youxingia wuxianensis]